MTHPRSQSGQASVEMVAVIPFLILAALAAWQIALAGHALWLTAGAARAAARAETVGANAERAARSALPDSMERGLVRRAPAGGRDTREGENAAALTTLALAGVPVRGLVAREGKVSRASTRGSPEGAAKVSLAPTQGAPRRARGVGPGERRAARCPAAADRARPRGVPAARGGLRECARGKRRGGRRARAGRPVATLARESARRFPAGPARGRRYASRAARSASGCGHPRSCGRWANGSP